jgi:hypothetical protein
MTRPARVPAQLSESLHKQLSAYALAASAAGVSTLALASPAAAKVSYTPTHEVIKANFPYILSFGKYNAAFEISVISGPCSSSDCGRNGGTAYFLIGWKYSSNRRPNYISGPSCTWDAGGCALALKKGARIPGSLMGGSHAVMAMRNSPKTGTYTYKDNWLPGTKNRYLGLKFYFPDGYHYGWARMSMKPSHVPAGMVGVLTGYAYETIPGKPIIAGKTKTEGPDVITMPDTAATTLGRLALGRK